MGWATLLYLGYGPMMLRLGPHHLPLSTLPQSVAHMVMMHPPPPHNVQFQFFNKDIKFQFINKDALFNPFGFLIFPIK